jgi:hypothetical protein
MVNLKNTINFSHNYNPLNLKYYKLINKIFDILFNRNLFMNLTKMTTNKVTSLYHFIKLQIKIICKLKAKPQLFYFNMLICYFM